MCSPASSSPPARLVTGVTVLGWAFWAVFAGEFALRAYVAKDQRLIWRRNWWQLVFLAVPFLRLLRGLTVQRTARVAGVVSATVRGSRSADRLLTGRIGWLATITTVVIVGASQLLLASGTYTHYGNALHGRHWQPSPVSHWPRTARSLAVPRWHSPCIPWPSSPHSRGRWAHSSHDKHQRRRQLTPQSPVRLQRES